MKQRMGKDITQQDNKNPIPDYDVNEFNAIKIYYRSKRLKYQANYFKGRVSKHRRDSMPWRSLSLPVFIVSTLFVVLHFITGWFKATPQIMSNPELFNLWRGLEIWSLALAAMVPVVGLGSRVWLGAFEPHRSANLYECKYNAVTDIDNKMAVEVNNAEALNSQILRAETVFENEHREWLRLMLETEWML